MNNSIDVMSISGNYLKTELVGGGIGSVIVSIVINLLILAAIAVYLYMNYDLSLLSQKKNKTSFSDLFSSITSKQEPKKETKKVSKKK